MVKLPRTMRGGHGGGPECMYVYASAMYACMYVVTSTCTILVGGPRGCISSLFHF